MIKIFCPQNVVENKFDLIFIKIFANNIIKIIKIHIDRKSK